MKQSCKTYILANTLFILSVCFSLTNVQAADYIKESEGGFRPVVNLETANLRAEKVSHELGANRAFQIEHEEVGRKTYLYAATQ